MRPIDLIYRCLQAHTKRRSLYEGTRIRAALADWVKRNDQILLDVPRDVIINLSKNVQQAMLAEEDQAWLRAINNALAPRTDENT